jgi:hypothetical protein
MKFSIEPFGPEYAAAAAAFNQRMRAANAPTAFLLPEPSTASRLIHGVTTTNHVAVDPDGAVRGGFVSWEHPAIVGNAVQTVINIQSPLSEGIIDPAYMLVGPQLIKYAIRRTPYVYVVGMGADTNPLPRLLKAMGWKVRAVPFYFRMLRPARCVRQLGPLRNPAWKRIAAHIAAITGAASIGAQVAHRMTTAARTAASDYQADAVTEWGDWADSAWNTFAARISFGVLRNSELLRFFYPLTSGTPRAWKLERGGKVAGWFGILISVMEQNRYFGNLTVATLTDCVGSERAIQTACALAVQKSKELGADLLITNQQHQEIQEACVAAGWRQGPSNFLFASSKALTEGVLEDSVYVTRRDGDGLVNLAPGTFSA